VDTTVTWKVISPDGDTVAVLSQQATIAGSTTAQLGQRGRIQSPQLWSPENPRLYTLVTTVLTGGKTVDSVTTSFGIRTVGFDANRGFMLNGEPYQLKGTSNHQDSAGVGSALPDAIQYYRVSRLKEMGCNAYRTTHNPPTPELLDACDKLGMLVMDENRQLGSDEHHEELLEELVERDRNHPSVAIWSIGNEEFEVEKTITGQRVASTMQAFLKRIDPTRPVTCNADLGNDWTGVDAAVEVRGWSYHVGQAMDDYHRDHPLQPNVGSEQGSTVSTRGIYANDPVRGYVSAYDDNAPAWAQTAETWVSFFGTRPWLSGGFVWTGFDYRGEPTPYGWPCINSHFGIMDTCGFPKDNFYYYQSQWTDKPMVHILPHWNWAGREGQDMDVRTQSNAEEVELSLNGRSLGRKPMQRFSEIKWTVPYEAGVLHARAYSAGRLVAEAKVETTGAPSAVRLSPDRAVINADGQDVALVTVLIADSKGRVVPTAGNKVSFQIEGPGKIIGVGNGDPSSHEPDTLVSIPMFRTVADRRLALEEGEGRESREHARGGRCLRRLELGPDRCQRRRRLARPKRAGCLQDPLHGLRLGPGLGGGRDCLRQGGRRHSHVRQRAEDRWIDRCALGHGLRREGAPSRRRKCHRRAHGELRAGGVGAQQGSVAAPPAGPGSAKLEPQRLQRPRAGDRPGLA
jgi:beta-galactosidase